MKFTNEVFRILNPILIIKVFCINSLSINPKVLPHKTIIIEVRSKTYIFNQPFLTLLGSSNNLLEAISTLTHTSLSLTFQ